MAESRFPRTRHSVVAALSGDDPAARKAAWDTLATAYWKPVYKYLRLRWRADAERARDWTQDFFARALEKGAFAAFDPARARFRTYVRMCVDGFASNALAAERRHKRGGGAPALVLDFDAAESELAGVVPPAPDRLEDYFHQEWTRALFEQAVGDLERVCDEERRAATFAAFRRYDLEAPERGEKLSYADVARELGVPVTQVTNWLHWARARLRQLVLQRLREACPTDEDYRAEARALLGGSEG